MASYIYKFLNYENKIIYIGKTNNLKQRMRQHFGPDHHLPDECYSQVFRIFYADVHTKYNSELMETLLIQKYHPEYNTDKKYNKEKEDLNIITNEPEWKELFFVKKKTRNNGPGIEFLHSNIPPYINKKYLTREAAAKFLEYNKNKLNCYQYEFYHFAPSLMAHIQTTKELEQMYNFAEKHINDIESNLDEYVSMSVSDRINHNFIAFNVKDKNDIPLFNFYLRVGILNEINDSIYSTRLITPEFLKEVETKIRDS